MGSSSDVVPDVVSGLVSKTVSGGRVIGTLAVVSAALLGGAVPKSAVAACWRPPVVGVVVDAYREPACRWCAGNRGLEYRVEGELAVRVAAPGRVVYAGAVAGDRYVVVELANGWRHTYGRLSSTQLQTGDVVLAHAEIGRAVHRFFFGLRIGDDYADPAPHLGSIVGRWRLIPLDGTAARPAPSPSIRCRVSRPAR